MKTAEQIYQEVVNELEKYPYTKVYLKNEYAIIAMERYAEQFKKTCDKCKIIKNE